MLILSEITIHGCHVGFFLRLLIFEQLSVKELSAGFVLFRRYFVRCALERRHRNWDGKRAKLAATLSSSLWVISSRLD